LKPWAVLIVESDSLAPREGIWQPVIEFPGATLTPRPELRLTCATPDAVIRCTLDGSEPSETSPVYRSPVALVAPVSIRAKAFLNGRSSQTATRSLDRIEFSPPLALNGDFEAGLDHWLRRRSGKAEMETEIVPKTRLEAGPAARIKILKSDGLPYHLRLLQKFLALKGRSYTLRFTAWSDKPTRIRAGLQGVSSPHTVVGMRMIDVETEPQTFLVVGHNAKQDMPAYIQFDCGASEAGTTIWIDQVALFARD